MIGYGTAYQRGAFITASLLTGQLIIHFIRRRTVVLVVLLAAVVIVASAFTWQSGSSDRDRTLIAGWCVTNGAVAGVLRAAVHGVYPTLFGRDRLDSALLHASLWDSVGAALAVLVSDWLCLVVRAWIVVFAAGAAAVAYAGLECARWNTGVGSDRRSRGSGRSVVAGTRAAREAADDRESLSSVCMSPSEALSLSTISSGNRFDVRPHLAANGAYYSHHDVRHTINDAY